MSNERHLPFAEAVSLEGWLSAIDSDGKATVHVDVTFGHQRIGADPDTPVRFVLALRKAEVVVIVGAEPLTIDRGSVARDPDLAMVTRSVSSERSVTADTSTETEIGGGLSFEGSPKLAATAKAARKGKQSRSSTTKAAFQMQEYAGVIRSIQGQTESGDYKWALVPRVGSTLVNKPWDAVKVPRFSATVGNASYRSQLDLAIRVEVRCLYEDVSIEKVVLKDDTLLAALQGKTGYQNRKAAAEAYIRHKVFNDGKTDPLDPYASMVFARVVCSNE